MSTVRKSKSRKNDLPKALSACDLRDKVLSSKVLLERHKKQIHLKPEGYVCIYCMYKTKNKKNLTRHTEHAHLGIKHECPTCGLFYASKSSLYMHSKVHSDERPFVLHGVW